MCGLASLYLFQKRTEEARALLAEARLHAGQISPMTNRTVTFEDADGTMCLLEPPQTLSNKTLDNSNSATLLDTGFVLQDDGDTSKQLAVDLSSLPTGVAITATLPAFPSTSSREWMFTSGTQTVTGTKTYEACDSITATNFTVADDPGGTDETFRARRLIVLQNGRKSKAG